MRRTRTTALTAAALTAATTAALAATAPPAGAHEIPKTINKTTRAALDQVSDATAKYEDVEVAKAEGFVPMGGCVSNPDGPGAMGVHFVDMSRLDSTFELTRPEVLIYEPQWGGRMRFVAVEYVVVDADQDPATDTRPTFPGGVTFHGAKGGGAEGPLFYPLHAWIGKRNPAGVFVDYNRRVSCS